MAKEKTVKARVLVEGAFGKVNDVITVPEDEAAAAGGQIDTDPGAVAYAEKLAKAAEKEAASE